MAGKDNNHQILLTSANNDAVNDIADKVQEALTLLQKDGHAPQNKFVVRLHTLETEKSTLLRDVSLARPIPENARPQTVTPLTAEGKEMLNRLQVAYLVYEKHKQATAQKFEGVADRRVRVLEQSLGYRALQVAGIIGGAPFAQPDHESIRGFAQGFRHYLKGMVYIAEEKIRFQQRTKALLDLTLQSATCAVTTMAVAATPVFHTNFKPVVVTIDEFARAKEQDAMPLVDKYPQAECRIFVGDINQLGPVVKSTKEANPFFAQNRVSAPGPHPACRRADYHASPPFPLGILPQWVLSANWRIKGC